MCHDGELLIIKVEFMHASTDPMEYELKDCQSSTSGTDDSESTSTSNSEDEDIDHNLVRHAPNNKSS